MIVSTLREEIASGELPPGTRMQQSELAQRFLASTTPVREALRQLEAAGLVVGVAHRGVTVAAPDADQVISTYVMLRLLEPYAARRAATQMSRADFAHARTLCDDFSDAWSNEDGRRAWRLDEQFHFTIYDRCGLQTLSDEIRRLWYLFPWAGVQIHDSSLHDPADEHRGMLDALIRGDDARIQLLFEHHVLSGFRLLEGQWGHEMTRDPFQLDIQSQNVPIDVRVDED